MKKILVSATALIFTVALFAQTTGSTPVTAKPAAKQEMAQSTSKPVGQTGEMKAENKKHCCAGKTCNHKGKEHSEK